jgi:hypothetical protein
MNAAPHAGTGTAPVRLLFGDAITPDRHLLVDSKDFEGKSSTVEDYIQQLQVSQATLVAASQQHQEKMVAQRLKDSPATPTTFQVGDYVLVSYPNRPPSKLAPRWRGPMVIVEQIGSNSYSCQDLTTLHVVELPVTRLKLFDASRTANVVEIAAGDHDEYVVEAIVDHKAARRKSDMEFKVRWRGYDPSYDLWLPYAEVRDLEALDAYLADHPELLLKGGSVVDSKSKSP